MDGSRSRDAGGNSGGQRRIRPRNSPPGCGVVIVALGSDVLCAIFCNLDHWDLARCSAVCKHWHSVINSSTLMRDVYYKLHPSKYGISIESVGSETSLRSCLQRLAMRDHSTALVEGSVEVHQWAGHSVGVKQCRMKMGSVATAVGDKFVKLWQAESGKLIASYSIPDVGSLIDFDFDESKVVGLINPGLCIWRRSGKRSLFQSSKASSSRYSCMRYIDPEAVIGSDDGRARIFDMYSGSCSRIIRLHEGPVTCLALDEQLILGGSSFGKISVVDLSSGQWMASLKSSFSPIGITSLCFNSKSHLVFAGSTAGYSHCWDLRMLRPLWETRVTSNIIYSINHLSEDSSTLAIGGIDGVLRIVDQKTGEVLSSIIQSSRRSMQEVHHENDGVGKYNTISLEHDVVIDSIPKSMRPPITCLAVGMKKIVTTHNERIIRVWKFHASS